MREFTEALRKLWSGEAVHMDGEFVKLAGARLAFKPSAPIPIYIAAMGPDMLRLAGRIGDGVVLSAGLSTDSVRAIARALRRRRRQGRPRSRRTSAAPAICSSAPRATPKEAVDAVRQKLAFVMRNKFLAANIKASGIAVDQEAVMAAIARRDIAGAAALVPDEAVEAFGIAGTPQHCTKRLRDFIDAGINEPVLGLLGSAENCLLALDVMREFVGIAALLVGAPVDPKRNRGRDNRDSG